MQHIRYLFFTQAHTRSRSKCWDAALRHAFPVRNFDNPSPSTLHQVAYLQIRAWRLNFPLGYILIC